MGAPKKCRRVGVHNCNWCSTGTYKRPARRKDRHESKRTLRSGSLV